MNSDDQKKPSDDLPSVEEVEQMIGNDPVKQKAFSDAILGAVTESYGSLTGDLRIAADKVLAIHRTQRCIEAAKTKMGEIAAVMSRPPGSMLAEERLAQINALYDELTDILLDLPEPHRTNFLKNTIPQRDAIRALKVD